MLRRHGPWARGGYSGRTRRPGPRSSRAGARRSDISRRPGRPLEGQSPPSHGIAGGDAVRGIPCHSILRTREAGEETALGLTRRAGLDGHLSRDQQEIETLPRQGGGGAAGRGGRRSCAGGECCEVVTCRRGRRSRRSRKGRRRCNPPASVVHRPPVPRPLHHQHRLFRRAAASARLPPGGRPGAAAGNPGGCHAARLALGRSGAAAGPDVRVGDDPDRGGPAGAAHAAGVAASNSPSSDGPPSRRRAGATSAPMRRGRCCRGHPVPSSGRTAMPGRSPPRRPMPCVPG